MTQAQLAKAVALSQRTLVNIETNRVHPHFSTILKIAEVLGVIASLTRGSHRIRTSSARSLRYVDCSSSSKPGWQASSVTPGGSTARISIKASKLMAPGRDSPFPSACNSRRSNGSSARSGAAEPRTPRRSRSIPKEPARAGDRVGGSRGGWDPVRGGGGRRRVVDSLPPSPPSRNRPWEPPRTRAARLPLGRPTHRGRSAALGRGPGVLIA